ncbi:hypothetical protein [Fodinicola feengrottensis]|uniref:Transposase n=1 Tax=Fodinicola feengrottensis TaxID=435914 RepID=A0ABP4UJP4_9ACTN|nr:hypothetical protein [Fodinicola feengrottensis]
MDEQTVRVILVKAPRKTEPWEKALCVALVVMAAYEMVRPHR